MKNNIIKPTGLKGRDKMDRVKFLMETLSPSTESTSNPVEMTKIGPDGNIYAIVRENHEFYIKISNRKQGVLMVEDFQYIGGLQNKKMECYPTYEKAIKHLNLKFHSLNESLNLKGSYNVFKDDNLLGENMSEFFGTDVIEESYVEEAIELTEAEKAVEEIINPTPVVKVELSESEKAIDSMLGESKGMSMLDAISGKDDDAELNEDAKKFLSNLSESEIISLYNELKKKV